MSGTTESRLGRYDSIRNINIDNKIIDVISYEVETGVSDGDEIIFAYVYSNQYTEEVEYLALGNNILSRDGSYLCGFFKYSSFIVKSNIIENVVNSLEKLDPGFKKKITYKRVYRPDNHSQKAEKLIPDLFCLKTLAKYIIITFVLRKQSRIFNVNLLNRLFNGYNIHKELEDSGLDFNTMSVLFNRIGQKIVPKGFYYMDNKTVKSREYKNESTLLYRLSKEVFNKKTPAFAIVITSTRLSNTSIDIWDNNSLIDKLNNSRVISSSDKYKIKDVYAGKTNMFIMEDCGDTLARYISNGGRMLGDIMLDRSCMESTLFQIFHSIYILNILGFVHGDTHLANITVRETVKWFNDSNSLKTNKSGHYSVFGVNNGKSNYFKVKFYGAYITLIDLGRSVDYEFVEKNKKDISESILKTLRTVKVESDSIRKMTTESLTTLFNLCDMYKVLQGVSTFMKSTSSLDGSEGVENFVSGVSKYIVKEIENYVSGKVKRFKSIHEYTAHIICSVFEFMKIEKVPDSDKGVVDIFI